MTEVIIKKTYREITCNRCNHKWLYGGKSDFICSCPKCRTSIVLHPKRKKISRGDLN
jgi:DNA-directed RNA polymerase subunit RPC12/RpoP